MKDIESPSGIDLHPDPPSAVRLSRRAGILVLLVVTAVVGLVGYGIATRRQRAAAAIQRTDPTRMTAASDAGKIIASEVPTGVLPGNRQLVPPADQQTLQPPDEVTRARFAGQPQISQHRPPPVYTAPQPSVRELTFEEKARIAAFRQEQEALSAPTGTGGSPQSPGRMSPAAAAMPTRESDVEQMTTLLRAMQGPEGQRGGSIDLKGVARGLASGSDRNDSEDYTAQNMQDRKRAFVGDGTLGARQNYAKSSRVRPLSAYEIKAGWDIPAVLEQAINSDLPGEVRALVRESVYDTGSGQFILIPQGSRLVGRYDSRIAYAQDGVTVVWDRLIFPDGSSIDLEGMVAQDVQGRAGLRHDVDRHYRRLLGFGLLTSGFSAAFQLSQSRRGGLLAYPSVGETAGSAVGAELSRLGADVTRRNLNVQPTIKVPVGFRFNVRVHRDLLFEGPYSPVRM